MTVEVDGRLTALIETLARARRRSALRLFLDGLVTSVAIGLGLFSLLTLLNLVLGGLAPILTFSWLSLPAWLAEWRPAPMPQHAVIAVLGALAALVVAQFAASSRRPGIARLAQAADQRFGLEERLSTALQLSRTPERSRGVIVEALLRDVARRGASIDPQRLAPLRLKWQALAVPLLAVLATALIIWPPEPIAITSSSQAGIVRTLPPGAMGEAERGDTAAEMRAIAAILTQDGEERSNPTLQALGNELNRLGLELEANPNATRAEVTQDLQRLLDLATEAYARAGVAPDDPANHAALIETAIEAVDPALADGGGALPQATADAGLEEPALDAPFEGIGIDAGAPGNGLAPPPGIDVRAEDINPAVGAGVPADVRGRVPDEYEDPYYEADAAETIIPIPDDAEIIGAGEGFGGDVAGVGAGGNPLDGNGVPLNPVATDGEMLLADPDPGNGRMITLNLPPLEELMAVGIDGLEAGAWRAFLEHEVVRGTIRAEDLEAVGRYFQALQAEAGE